MTFPALGNDLDGIADENDNCPEAYNSGQDDQDGDGVGDVCDLDMDGDFKLNFSDNCPKISNPFQEDIDQDGKGDYCDNDNDNDTILDANENCPLVSNLDQADDIIKNGVGDACDDNDKVGYFGPDDNFPADDNPFQQNMDNDALGDVCDKDIDGFGHQEPGKGLPCRFVK